MLTERCSLSGRSDSVWAAMDQKGLSWASAVEAARMVREGAVTSVELVQACLARVREIDGQVQAWTFLDPEHALAQARAADEAAAVAAGMVPLALGSQTTGSTVRPASYCGVYGLKPTHGLIPRHGMFQLSRTLDHVGLFARGIEDIALLLEELAGYDERDPDSRPRARVPYRALAAEEPPLAPMFAFVKTSLWDRVDADAREAFAELVGHLGDRVEELELTTPSDEVLEWQRAVGGAEIAINLRREWEHGRDKLSRALRERIEQGREVRAVDYLRALGRIPELNTSLTELFEQRYDAILTPAAFGTAPKGLESTGDPAFCALWTLCGVPALSVPLMQGANGLPLGVQLVGARHRDGQLLRTARWLVAHLSDRKS